MGRGTAGPRHSKIPFSGLAVLLFAASAVLLLAPLYTAIGWSNGLRGTLLLLMSAVASARAGRRKGLPTADAVLQEDTRPPVLYLRSFGSERALFAQRDEAALAHRRWRAFRMFFTDPNEEFLTLERYLSGEVTRRIGPFVGLGNPADRLPPEGVARNWVTEGWEPKVKNWIEEAQCIIAEPRASENLGFEFSAARKHAQKVFIVTSPYGKGVRRAPLRLTVANRARRITPPSWPALAEMLRAAEYDVAIECPPPGSVVGFDAEGRAHIVTSGARTARDYVQAIARSVP